MNRANSHTVEKLDVESLIVDLLACGLGACIILFFIFSIKIIGQTNGVIPKPGNDKSTGKGSGYVSLLGDDGDKKKRMGSIRIVEFSGLSSNNYEAIRTFALSNSSIFWDDFKNFRGREKQEKDLIGTLRAQFQSRQKNLSFIVYADGMRELNFSFPNELKRNIEDTRTPNALVRVYALEGRSVKGDFKGLFRSEVYKIEHLNEFKLTFKIGRAANIERLITIDGIK